MRLTTKISYMQSINRFRNMSVDINKANNRGIDDRKFHQSYDDTSSYSEGMRLDNEIETFKRIQEASERAVSLTKNSDNAVSAISQQLDVFKAKLIQAGNEVHSETSLNAIANDLQQIRNHIVNIANTSINGQFLFSGTAINVKPFDDKGEYYGNAESMNILLGSHVHQDYNISGAELMKGRDFDYRKVISTNERLMDHRYNTKEPDQVHYLTLDSKIHDMVGRNYLIDEQKTELNVNDHFRGEEDFPPTYFYISGTRGSGQSFRAKFEMKDDESIGSLLRHIGELYGNTAENTLVKVELTKSGTIEITDLDNNDSRLNFSMFAATKRSDKAEIFKDIKEQIAKDNAKTKEEYENLETAAKDRARKEGIELGLEGDDLAEYIEQNARVSKYPAMSLEPTASTAEGATDIADAKNLDELKALAKEGKVYLQSFCNNAKSNPEGEVSGLNYARTQFDTSEQFLLSNVTQFRHDGRVASDGDKLFDCSTCPIELDVDKPHSVLKADITSRGGVQYHINIDLTAGYVEWQEPAPDDEEEGDTVDAGDTVDTDNTEAADDNVAIGEEHNELAEDISDPSALPLPGGAQGDDTQADQAGAEEGAEEGTVDDAGAVGGTGAAGGGTDVGDTGAVDEADGTGAAGAPADPDADPDAPAEPPRRMITRRMDITDERYDPAQQTSIRVKTRTENITFAQLNGILEMFASDNLPRFDIISDTEMPPEVGIGTMLDPDETAEINRAIDRAKSQVSVHLKDGKMLLEDQTSTTTKVKLSIYDAINGDEEFDFEKDSKLHRGDIFTFATNSSIVVDEQQLDVIKDLDRMIQAVRMGEYRSDNTDSSRMKNPGIQASIRRLDHIADHIRKTHTRIGAVQIAIEAARDRSEAMQINIQEVKNQVIGATDDGRAEAYLQLTTLMSNFQALMQTSAMINKLSLLDYMR